MVECGLAEQLKKFDYVRCDRWNYTGGIFDAQTVEPKELTLDVNGADVLVKIEAVNRYRLNVIQLDPAEPGEVVAITGLMDSDLYDKAKALYINHEELERFKAEAADKKAAEKKKFAAGGIFGRLRSARGAAAKFSPARAIFAMKRLINPRKDATIIN